MTKIDLNNTPFKRLKISFRGRKNSESSLINAKERKEIKNFLKESIKLFENLTREDHKDLISKLKRNLQTFIDKKVISEKDFSELESLFLIVKNIYLKEMKN
jgi:ribosomal protein S20